MHSSLLVLQGVLSGILMMEGSYKLHIISDNFWHLLNKYTFSVALSTGAGDFQIGLTVYSW
jgi:hypothetical protein